MARHKGSDGNAHGRLLDAAGRGFRLGGFGGIGVDAMAQAAGMTSGAFYAHFGSKADAFRLSVQHGMAALKRGVTFCQDQHGTGWRDAFVDFYLGEQMKGGLDQACALPSFSPDVARADAATRQVFETELDGIVTAFAAGLGSPPDRSRAWALIALLAGGASAARAVADEGLRAEILESTRLAAKAL